MFETPITVVGRLVTDIRRRNVGDRDVVKFRMASNTRRRTEDGTWEAGDSLFVNVNCWGRLVTGVAGSLKKGDAVIVVGSIHTSEYDDKDGQRRSSLELRASAVGPDLSRYIVKLEKHGQPGEAPAGGAEPTDDAASAESDLSSAA
jgi:single-strand DNA-binding protein